MNRLIDLLYLNLYYAFAFVIGILPRSGQVALARRLASLAWHLGKKRRTIIERNLEFAFPGRYDAKEKAHIGQEAYTNLIMTTFTIMQLAKIPENKILEMVSFEGEEHVREAMRQGKKIIFITGHYGNWELTSPATTLRFGLKTAVVGRRLDSESMEHILKRNRERFDIEVIYKQGATKGCMHALMAGKYLGILVDQSLPKKHGVEATFFGKKISHTPLASTLARRYDAVLIPLFIHTDDHLHYTIRYYPPIPTLKTDDKERDIREMTQAQADIMEKVIREHPGLWFWMHKRWKTYYPELYREETSRKVSR